MPLHNSFTMEWCPRCKKQVRPYLTEHNIGFCPDCRELTQDIKNNLGSDGTNEFCPQYPGKGATRGAERVVRPNAASATQGVTCHRNPGRNTVGRRCKTTYRKFSR